ncbi:MAG TPA: DUF1902 domain-containing protein [Patescibacteria group bacterium]|nr:DUF1902 domain-containing protein [Patescibacteria group bacterium]
MRHITITIEHLPENVYLATSEDLPGFTVEAEDREEIFKLSQTLALDFLKLDGEVAQDEQVSIEFEVKE